MDEILFGVKDEMNRLMKIDEEGHRVSILTEGERKDLHYELGKVLGKVLFDFLEDFTVREVAMNFIGSILAERHPKPEHDMSKVKSAPKIKYFEGYHGSGWYFWDGGHWDGPYATKSQCSKQLTAYKKARRER